MEVVGKVTLVEHLNFEVDALQVDAEGGLTDEALTGLVQWFPNYLV